MQTKWYNYLVGHEYGHHYTRDFIEEPSDFNKSDPEGSLHPDKLAAEILSDRIGANISGLTRNESIQFHLWYEKREYPRLIKVYNDYLKKLGVTRIQIPSLGSVQFGIRFRYRL